MTAAAGPPRLTLASFNVHCGVDGWGRPFDVVAECAALDADVLVMQESWAPDDGTPSTAALVAERLGYCRVEEAMAHGRLYGPDPSADRRWGPRYGHAHDTLRLDDDPRGREVAERQARPFGTGTFSVAVLTRVPFTATGVVELGKLRRDPARRLVVTGTVPVGGHTLTVLGTHMSHLLHRSPVQYFRLRAAVPPTDRPAVLAGDMNLWGPPVTTFLTGWHRAVRGRTWPAWRPHSQLDHVVATPAVSVVDARVATTTGSDHRPVRVTLSLG
ncbi:MAG: endonuclease/exonuclease/phosphatase family protein [Acidimicrobiales bacterium]